MKIEETEFSVYSFYYRCYTFNGEQHSLVEEDHPITRIHKCECLLPPIKVNRTRGVCIYIQYLSCSYHSYSY